MDVVSPQSWISQWPQQRLFETQGHKIITLASLFSSILEKVDNFTTVTQFTNITSLARYTNIYHYKMADARWACWPRAMAG